MTINVFVQIRHWTVVFPLCYFRRCLGSVRERVGRRLCGKGLHKVLRGEKRGGGRGKGVSKIYNMIIHPSISQSLSSPSPIIIPPPPTSSLFIIIYSIRNKVGKILDEYKNAQSCNAWIGPWRKTLMSSSPQHSWKAPVLVPGDGQHRKGREHHSRHRAVARLSFSKNLPDSR